jgi:hypothetical protein
LKRAIQKEIENPLAMRLMEGSYFEGDTIPLLVFLSKAHLLLLLLKLPLQV